MSPEFSFSISEYIHEEGEEASSHQQLSADNQERLRQILALWTKETDMSSQDADQLKNLVISIDQEVPLTLEVALRSVAQLEENLATAKRASQNITIRTSLLLEDSSKRQQVKDLHNQIQSAKQSLDILSPELAALEKQKADLEAQLALLNNRIQSCQDQIARLPNVSEAKSKISSAIKEIHHIKAKMTHIPGSAEEDERSLEKFNQYKASVAETLSKFLE